MRSDEINFLKFLRNSVSLLIVENGNAIEPEGFEIASPIFFEP
jgi:hypothetical protein